MNESSSSPSSPVPDRQRHAAASPPGGGSAAAPGLQPGAWSGGTAVELAGICENRPIAASLSAPASAAVAEPLSVADAAADPADGDGALLVRPVAVGPPDAPAAVRHRARRPHTRYALPARTLC